MKNSRARALAVFTIGYDGARAVVDGQALKRYGTLSTKELAEKGLFRAAWASALYAGSEEEMRLVREISGGAFGGVSPDGASGAAAPVSFERLFGVFARPPAVTPAAKRGPLIL